MGMGAGFGTGGASGSSGQSPFEKWLGYANGPPAQGQPETIAALREAMAQRPGGGITADPTGTNFFAMPQPNASYGGAFNDLLTAMMARGPQVKAEAEGAAKTAALSPEEAAAARDRFLGVTSQQALNQTSPQGRDGYAQFQLSNARTKSQEALKGLSDEELALWSKLNPSLGQQEKPAGPSWKGGR